MQHSFKNQFLIAMPNLHEAPFHHSVILVVEHSAAGAMGLIINQPTDLPFAKILEHFELKIDNGDLLTKKVLRGGPLKKEHGFILHRPVGHWRSTVNINDNLGLTTSRDILAAMIGNEGPDESLIILGCSAWQPGQLEDEMRSNCWLSAPVDPYILFGCPHHERWDKAAGLIGVDLERLSCEAGHG
ncbi:MAG: YqgE/AlgH family protein [Gammaproteobacteria bacterium]|jgi:putative transcriptional regulator